MSDISQDELSEIYAFAVQLGKDAGQMLMQAARLRTDDTRASQKQEEHAQKANAVDLVTETDENIEAFIKSQISSKFPTHKFVGEVSPNPTIRFC